MATIIQTVCDGCGKPKGSVNHWYMAERTANSLYVWRWGDGKGQEGRKHYCGQECVTKALNDWMQAQKAEFQ